MLTNPFETESITGLTGCHVRSRRDSPLGPVRILTRERERNISTCMRMCIVKGGREGGRGKEGGRGRERVPTCSLTSADPLPVDPRLLRPPLPLPLG